MDYAEMSNKLVDLLGLKGKPIAVSLIKRTEDIPKSLKEIEKPRRYCQMLQDARFDGTVSLATAETHACKGGAAAIGLIDYGPNLKTGALYHYKLNKEVTLGVAKRVVDQMPRPAPGSTIATIIAPLDHAPTDPDGAVPDVVVVMAGVVAARRIVQAVIYRHGGRFNANFAGIQSTCADATGYPYISGNVNVSIGCDGAAKNAGLADDELVVGIPAELLEEITGTLSECAPAWDDWQKGRVDYVRKSI
ncbi:MAG: DUF169 domain-containing protein [Methanosarcinales archaeon]|nr:DUF169 domain-containing protein [Methanosarcinales archaeon]